MLPWLARVTLTSPVCLVWFVKAQTRGVVIDLAVFSPPNHVFRKFSHCLDVFIALLNLKSLPWVAFAREIEFCTFNSQIQIVQKRRDTSRAKEDKIFRFKCLAVVWLSTPACSVSVNCFAFSIWSVSACRRFIPFILNR